MTIGLNGLKLIGERLIDGQVNIGALSVLGKNILKYVEETQDVPKEVPFKYGDWVRYEDSYGFKQFVQIMEVHEDKYESSDYYHYSVKLPNGRSAVAPHSSLKHSDLI